VIRGFADGSEELNWPTEGDPEDWPVSAIRRCGELHARIELTATEVIVAMLTGRPALPRFLPELDPDEAFDPVPRPTSDSPPPRRAASAIMPNYGNAATSATSATATGSAPRPPAGCAGRAQATLDNCPISGTGLFVAGGTVRSRR
jgi:hypothetical protein